MERRREVNDVMRHDMRTRVGIGKGYVAMLLAHYDRMTPEQRAMALTGLGEAFDRLDEFSRRVLLDEKIATHDVVAHRADVPLATLVDAARAACAGIEVEIARGTPETLHIDPVLARDIVDNLVANARTAAPEGTAVTLRLRCDRGALRIEVHDEGAGVTEDDRAVLFTRYGRTGQAREAGSPGLGLGLWIVRRLVEAHGGRYGVELDEGTTFWVELPVSPNAVLSPW